ncbi:MAG TPA: response regulator [Thermodesulfobacteriota bacterium]|nr:response regulator [Thermodesulfobacteriota bacterium]
MDNTVEENMEKIVAWLMNIERLAGDVYKQAAHYFQDDPTLRQFLEHIADDEAEHFRIMEEALKYVKTHPIPMQPVTIDDETNTKIGRIFDEVFQKITAQTLTKDQVYKDIVAIERSKFNDVLLCVVNTLKELSGDFARAAMVLQNHQRFIKYYYENNLEWNDLNDQLRALPHVWQEKILIVDDEEPIRILIMALLNEEGVVDSAYNGEEALEKLKHTYYKLIISDIDMPTMDGISFYRQALHLFPAIKKRFLFFSGKFTPEHISLLSEQGLRFIRKPAAIKEIRKNALAILLDQSS